MSSKNAVLVVDGGYLSSFPVEFPKLEQMIITEIKALGCRVSFKSKFYIDSSILIPIKSSLKTLNYISMEAFSDRGVHASLAFEIAVAASDKDIEHIILVTDAPDTDFASVISRVQEMGKRMYVSAFEEHFVGSPISSCCRIPLERIQNIKSNRLTKSNSMDPDNLKDEDSAKSAQLPGAIQRAKTSVVSGINPITKNTTTSSQYTGRRWSKPVNASSNPKDDTTPELEALKLDCSQSDIDESKSRKDSEDETSTPKKWSRPSAEEVRNWEKEVESRRYSRESPTRGKMGVRPWQAGASSKSDDPSDEIENIHLEDSSVRSFSADLRRQNSVLAMLNARKLSGA